MKRQIFFTLIVAAASLPAAAQTRTVTNNDLDKYRTARLRAERELAVNYREMGFPSPEELEKQAARSKVERARLARSLRAARLERERLETERLKTIAELEASSRSSDSQTVILDGGIPIYYSGLVPTYLYYGSKYFPYKDRYRYPWYRNRFGNGYRYGIPQYRATPAGVFPVGAPATRRVWSNRNGWRR